MATKSFVMSNFMTSPTTLITIISLGLFIQFSLDSRQLYLELALEKVTLNNTRKAEANLVFFNRVPKVGSQTMISLLQRMQQFNNFTHFTDSAELKAQFGEKTTLRSVEEKRQYCEMFAKNFSEPSSYSKHISFFHFHDCGPQYKQPIYVNFVREPVQRIISWYYYIRAPWYAFEMNANKTKYVSKCQIYAYIFYSFYSVFQNFCNF